MRLIVSLPCLIVLLTWLWPLTLPLGLKIFIAVLMLGAAQFSSWCKLSSGSVFAPEFPRPLVILFNWAFGTLLFLALLQCALILSALVWSLAVWRLVHIPDAVRLAAAGLAGLLTAVAVANAIRVPAVRDVMVFLPGLPERFDGYRLLQLSDLHISRLFPALWTEQVVARANAAGANLIVVTGDFIDGSVAMRRADIAPLRQLHAPDGVLAIPGNHEYFFDYADWIQHLSGLGMQMLLNAHTVLTRGDAHLVVAGVTDLSAEGHGQAGPDLAAALAGRPAGAPVVLLDHQPRNAPDAAKAGVALQLSGHTHGGMIPGLASLVARGNNGFVSGRYTVGGMTLYVSNGTGLWPGFALRLACPPEITRFCLRAGKADA
ncbi:metallophosphoesterase [Acetobacter farinalis]|uniref:Metallophosphoesterase n=1 Tax=Acetobacter farinalis TaxID=1260984 RepID=A0ABT3Q8J8_9PROT|nr:metallophosphoesterase [Acetobacter farinalis]MCX2561600.1 metallophosphoesterase [Acetobacter farinalis]NHO30099.1 metallophosphoesterase [Acetobacter farinalis]